MKASGSGAQENGVRVGTMGGGVHTGPPVVATSSPGAQTVRGCKIREGEGGVLINVSTAQPFSYKDDCVELNPHVGGNAAATAAARVAVSDFVRQVLKLE